MGSFGPTQITFSVFMIFAYSNFYARMAQSLAKLWLTASVCWPAYKNGDACDKCKPPTVTNTVFSILKCPLLFWYCCRGCIQNVYVEAKILSRINTEPGLLKVESVYSWTDKALCTSEFVHLFPLLRSDDLDHHCSLSFLRIT